MKTLLFSLIAVASVFTVVGCADDTATTTQRTTYTMDRSDPKDMTPVAVAPAPAPQTNAADVSDESGGIHSSGNMGGER